MDLTKHFFLVIAGFIVFFWTLYFMINPLKYALALTLFAITFVVGELLLRGNESSAETKVERNLPRFASLVSSELVITVVFMFSLGIIFLISPISREIFVYWNALPLPSAMRLLAAFGMNFFPGYLVLAVVGKPKLGTLSKLVTSYLLSVVLLTITGFVSALLVGIVGESFLDIWFGLCIVLVGAFVLKFSIRRRPRMRPQIFAIEKGGFLPALLIALTMLLMGIWLCWMYSQIGFFIGGPGSDMWRHHGFAQAFIDYKAFTWLQIPWWFHLYLASFITISGVPSVNAYMALYPLIAMSVLSFCCMCFRLFRDKRIASLASLSYALFSGPAWLYALELRNSVSVQDSDWIHIIYTLGGKFLYQGWYPPFVVGFNAAVIAYTALWWLVYFTWQSDLHHKSNLFLVSAIFALIYLLHGVEAIIFLIFLAAVLLSSLITRNNEARTRVRWTVLSILLGLGVVAVIDFSLTSQYEYFSQTSSFQLASKYYYLNSPSFYALLLGSAVIFALTYGRFIEKRFKSLKQTIQDKIASKHFALMKKHLVKAALCAYGISLIVFVVLLPHITNKDLASGRIPWYAYPALGGVPFFLGLLGFSSVLSKWADVNVKIRRTVVFLALTIVLLFIFGQALSFVNTELFYTGFYERRVIVYVYAAASPLMAYALISAMDHVEIKTRRPKDLFKIGLISLLTSLLIIAGVSSTLMAGDFASQVFFTTSLTREELEALDFLHYSLPSGAIVAYMDEQSGECIRAFANDKWTYDTNQWLGQFSDSPSSTVAAIKTVDAKFLYINLYRDALDLEENLFVQQLIKVLPMVFNNSEVAIYSIPSLHSPSSLSPIGLISSGNSDGVPYDAYVLWLLALMTSGYSYSVITNASDALVLNAAQSIIVPYDPWTKEETDQLLEWVSKGGHLMISNTNHFGFFDELFGLTSESSLVNCDSTNGWKTLYGRGSILLEETNVREGSASLRLQNNQSSWEEWVYMPQSFWNLTGEEYLGIWVYGNGGGPQWYLYLTDVNGNEKYFRYDLSTYDSATGTYEPAFVGWKLLLIPIMEYFNGLDLSAIKKLRIVTGFQLPVNMVIDDIFVSGENGQTRPIMINGIQGEASIDLPTTEVNSMVQTANGRVVANYTWNSEPVTPFAIQKEIGNGDVTYLNADLLYESIISESNGFSSSLEMLARVLATVGATS